MKNITEKFGELLFELRKKKGLSQEAVAKLGGVSRTYIVRLEQKERQPTLTTIFLIAKGLGIKPSKLIAMLEPQVNYL